MFFELWDALADGGPDLIVCRYEALARLPSPRWPDTFALPVCEDAPDLGAPLGKNEPED